MPKTAVDENANSSRGKDEIRLPWKVPNVQSIPKARSVKESSHAKLGFRVLVTDVGHDPTSNGF